MSTQTPDPALPWDGISTEIHPKPSAFRDLTEPAHAVAVTHVKKADRPAVILFSHDGDSTAVALSAADARRYAAAILNAADALDGTTPLVFFPRLPDEPKPRP